MRRFGRVRVRVWQPCDDQYGVEEGDIASDIIGLLGPSVKKAFWGWRG